MKKYFYWVLPLLFASAVGNAQTCKEILEDAQKHEKAGEFFKAYQKYDIALFVCPNKKDIENRKRNAVKELEKLKDNAVKAEIKAKDNEQKALAAQQTTKKILDKFYKANIEIGKQREIADKAMEEKDKIVNSSFFIHDKFGLVYNRGAFRFIDKRGNEVEKLGTWQWAQPFEARKKEAFNNFVAIVIDKVDYTKNLQKDFKLLDTLGNTFPLAIDLSYLNEKTEAFIYGDDDGTYFPNQIIGNTQLEVLGLIGVSNIPSTIRNLKNLRILVLVGEQTEQLPKEIGELHNLEYLDLELDNLKNLSGIIGKLTNLERLELRDIGTANFNINELANLKKLKILNLKGLNLESEEEENIIRLLPNCKITF